MNEKVLEKLEFHKIQEKLGSYCSSSLGRKKTAALFPSLDHESRYRRALLAEQMKNIMRLNPGPPLGGISDISGIIRKAAAEGMLDEHEVVKTGDFCRAVRKMHRYILHPERKERYPELEEMMEGLTVIPGLEKEADRIIGPDGRIADNASSRLAGIRKGVRDREQKLKTYLNNTVRNENNKKYLQESIVTFRNDRYVIPVRQEYRSLFPGIVHDQSSSGATLFIEPLQAVEMNNDIRKKIMDMHEEERRILREFSTLLYPYPDVLRENMDLLAEADFLCAASYYAEESNAVMAVYSRDAVLDLREARHPLIDADSVVPVSFAIGRDYKALIITGPNTGGKTVTLKTAGLLTLMAYCGLHIPAGERSVVGSFSGVYSDIGDEQSIEQSLSTFSSHIRNISSILGDIRDNALVLLDELGAGTDPAEGASLAVAVIEYLVAKKAVLFATTHYGELKAFAYGSPLVENASMEFDVETLSPTYRLLTGVPGRSNAFDISLRIGMKPEIIEKAREMNSGRKSDVSRMIADLENSRDEALREKEILREKGARLAEKIEELEKEKARTASEKQSVLDDAERQAAALVEEALQESRRILEKMRKISAGMMTREESDVLEEAKKLEEIRDIIKQPAPEKKKKAGGRKSVFVPGEYVYLPEYSQYGTVAGKAGSSGEYPVQVGILKVFAPAEKIRKAEEQKEETFRYSGNRAIKSSKSMSVRTEIDFRGSSIEEAETIVDKFLDDALLANIKTVYLIHGTGTGALRRGVREYLRRNRAVVSFRDGAPGEGGKGVTVVEL